MVELYIKDKEGVLQPLDVGEDEIILDFNDYNPLISNTWTINGSYSIKLPRTEHNLLLLNIYNQQNSFITKTTYTAICKVSDQYIFDKECTLQIIRIDEDNISIVLISNTKDILSKLNISPEDNNIVFIPNIINNRERGFLYTNLLECNRKYYTDFETKYLVKSDTLNTDSVKIPDLLPAYHLPSEINCNNFPLFKLKKIIEDIMYNFGYDCNLDINEKIKITPKNFKVHHIPIMDEVMHIYDSTNFQGIKFPLTFNENFYFDKKAVVDTNEKTWSGPAIYFTFDVNCNNLNTIPLIGPVYQQIDTSFETIGDSIINDYSTFLRFPRQASSSQEFIDLNLAITTYMTNSKIVEKKTIATTDIYITDRISDGGDFTNWYKTKDNHYILHLVICFNGLVYASSPTNPLEYNIIYDNNLNSLWKDVDSKIYNSGDVFNLEIYSTAKNALTQCGIGSFLDPQCIIGGLTTKNVPAATLEPQPEYIGNSYIKVSDIIGDNYLNFIKTAVQYLMLKVYTKQNVLYIEPRKKLDVAIDIQIESKKYELPNKYTNNTQIEYSGGKCLDGNDYSNYTNLWYIRSNNNDKKIISGNFFPYKTYTQTNCNLKEFPEDYISLFYIPFKENDSANKIGFIYYSNNVYTNNKYKAITYENGFSTFGYMSEFNQYIFADYECLECKAIINNPFDLIGNIIYINQLNCYYYVYKIKKWSSSNGVCSLILYKYSTLLDYYNYQLKYPIIPLPYEDSILIQLLNFKGPSDSIYKLYLEDENGSKSWNVYFNIVGSEYVLQVNDTITSRIYMTETMPNTKWYAYVHIYKNIDENPIVVDGPILIYDNE